MVLQEVVDIPTSCENGICRSCETAVVGGIPDHRDYVLNDEEHAANKTMMVCVGRSRTPLLILDL